MTAITEAQRTWEQQVRAIVRQVRYKDYLGGSYRLLVERDKKDPEGRVYLQVEADRIDIVTKEMGVGRGGKAYLSEHMTESELVRLAFGLFMAYEEHECREGFEYAGRRVFGPHIHIAALYDAAQHVDYRPPA